MTWFLLGIVAMVVLFTALNWARNANPKDIIKTIKWTAIGLGGAILLIVLLTKNFQLIWGLGVFLIPWLMRLNALRRLWKSMKGPSGGQRSHISAPFFDVYLDHDTGVMDGRIKAGPFEGALWSELSMAEGQQLYTHIEASNDPRSLQLLEAFLDRAHGTAWRMSQGEKSEENTAGSTSQRNHSGQMSVDEALKLLGLKPDATTDEIKAAHRRLMKQVHPDTGGSAYLAARVNEAKDILLNR
jgi:hypothetical protein